MMSVVFHFEDKRDWVGSSSANPDCTDRSSLKNSSCFTHLFRIINKQSIAPFSLVKNRNRLASFFYDFQRIMVTNT